MGAVFRPKDLPAGWRKMARESIKDFSPDTKDSVIKIIDSWEGTKSEVVPSCVMLLFVNSVYYSKTFFY
jgi:hypothetical protein